MGDETKPIFIRIGRVCELTGLSTSTIYKRIADGTFPRPVKIGKGSRAVSVWSIAELHEFEREMLAQRGPALAAGPLDLSLQLAERRRKGMAASSEAA